LHFHVEPSTQTFKPELGSRARFALLWIPYRESNSVACSRRSVLSWKEKQRFLREVK
jgi:hypothetical protein